MATIPLFTHEADASRRIGDKRVKSVKLMRHLARLITPPNGHVLDPFVGSGSTGVACREEGFDFTGIEQSDDYVAIARKRCGLEE